MTPDTLQKVGIAVFSATFGWVIAQVTSTIQIQLYRKRIVRLLHEELKDLDKETTRILYYHARNLQLFGAKGIQESGMVGISNPVYTNYYKDALLSLNQNQRISLQLIHGLVATQNEVLKKIDETTTAIMKDHRENGPSAAIARGGETLGELAKAGYSGCAIIKWHIDFHLKHMANPNLSPETDDHKMYLKYLDSVAKEMNKTIESGKTIPKEEFEKIYSQHLFKPRPE